MVAFTNENSILIASLWNYEMEEEKIYFYYNTLLEKR